MNPFNIRQPQDRRKVYNEYIANLQMQIDNLAKTEGAVATLKTTGAPPVQPTDTRTVAEKLLDVDKQKKVLRQALLDITDGAEASKIMNTIADEDVVFLGVAWEDFSKMIKQKFASGILAPLFNEILQRYKRDYINGLSVQKGISSGHTTEELLLSMRDLMRLMPNTDQLRELRFTIQNIPEGSIPSRMKSTALTAVSSLDSLLLTSGDIEALDKMNPIDKAAAEKALNDGFSSVASGAIIQDLTQKLQQARGKELSDVLSTIIRDILITRDDTAQLEQAKAIAEQKQAAYESSLPELKSITAKQKSSVISQLKRPQEIIETFENLPSAAAEPVKVKISKELTIPQKTAIELIENPATLREDIKALPLGLLRNWVTIKIETGEIAKVTGVAKLDKEQLMILVDEFKSGVLPAAKAAVVTPKKVSKKAAAAPISTSIFVQKEYDPNMLLDDFENRAVTDYADKRAILEDMMQKGIMARELTKDEYADFQETMVQNRMRDEAKLIDFFKIAHLKMGGKGFKKGKKITFGCGLTKPTLMVKPDNIDFEKGLKREAAYIPIGKYVINKHKLRDNMLLMRTVKGGQIAELPQMSISPHLGKMLNKIINGHGFPSHNDLTEMSDSDKDIMFKVFKMSKAQGIESIPRPNKSKDEQEFNRFTILKGQILAGNNSKELIKEFKTLLVKLIHADKIPRRDAHGILLDLAALGF
jgi:hypothetical protein